MGETVEPFYKKYNHIEPVISEYRRRLIQPKMLSLHRYKPVHEARSLYVALPEFTGKSLSITVDIWNSDYTWSRKACFDHTPGQKYGFVFHDKRMLIMGGETPEGLSQSVSEK